MRKKRTWIEAKYWATNETLEVAQAAFSHSSAIGMAIDDGELPEGKSLHDSGKVLLTAYFEADNKSGILKSFTEFFSRAGLKEETVVQFSKLVEEDWQANFVRSCTTFLVAPDIYIVPSFEIEQFKMQPRGSLFIEIDPENAFGTGQHQTTKMCLSLIRIILKDIDEEKRKGFFCLDVGTGSGILAILMKKLLVKSVLATETDADALITAQKNFKKNGVTVNPLLVNENHRYRTSSYDVAVANILSAPLLAMAENLCSSVKPGGHLILSGILNSQSDEIIRIYNRAGATLDLVDTIDDWCAIRFSIQK